MKDKDRVEMPASTLHKAIDEAVGEDLGLASDRGWPKTGRTLWKRIREVTPLLEAHGIRAYRGGSNRTGRPIVLDTDFTDDEPDDPKYAKCGDDNGDGGDDNSRASSPENADTYAEGDDNGSWGRYFGPTLAFHTSDREEKYRQGESRPDLSSPSSPGANNTAYTPTPEQKERIEKLVGEGMSERLARLQVSGPDPSLVDALRRFLRRHTDRRNEKPSWYTVALWAEEYVDTKPTPLEVVAALFEVRRAA
jgi:hypothetical protein